MHKLLITTAVALALPALASATITSNTSASSESGGNIVGPGGKVETGASSASVSTSNVSGHSTSSIYIKTTVDGEVHEETYTSNSSSVDVSVKTTPKATTVDVQEAGERTRHEVVPASAPISAQSAATTSATTTATTSEPEQATLSLAASIVLAVQDFLAGILSWFR